MSDIVQIALIAGIPPTLAAVAAFVVGLRNSRKAAVIIAKADEIHAVTNSNLRRVTEALEAANTEIAKLRSAIAPKGSS